MTTERKIKIAAAAATLLFLLSLVGIGFLTSANRELQSEVNTEKLNGENLLSEKLALEKQIKDFRSEMLLMEGKNRELDLYLTDTKRRLEEREANVARLTKENAGYNALKKEHESIKKMRSDLMAQMDQLKTTNNNMQKEIGQLNNTISSLEKEKKELMAKLEAPQTQMIATNFMVEVRKKKEEKLTVRAKKTRSIAVSFELPSSQAQTLGNFYRIDLLSPTGVLINGKVKEVKVQKAAVMTASLDKQSMKEKNDKINLTFEPEDKLVKGVYAIIIYNGNQYLGSAQVKLVK